jgi:ribose transport system permease protein
MNSIVKKSFYKLLSTQWFYLLLVVALLVVVASLSNSMFLGKSNLSNILSQISVLGLISAGMTILIISGNFDISVGSMVGLSGSMMCMLLIAGVSDVIAIFACILIAVLCSALNGFLSISLKAPSFIITLATAGIFRGTALAITDGRIQNIFGKFEYLAATRIFNFLPLIFLVSLIGYFAIGGLLEYSQFGRRVYAIGDNPMAAFLAGIRVNYNKILFFVISGVMVGIATIMLVSRLGGCQASTGAGFELQAIGAVVIGGVPINGGRGNIVGTFVGVLLMGVIFNVLNVLRVNPFLQEIAYGLLIVLSIAISSIRIRLANKLN